LVRGAKIGDKQSRQSNSKYKFMQYVFFELKGIRRLAEGNGVWGKAARGWKI